MRFNTNLVPPDEAPRSYQDLLQPKWRGKMNFGSDEYAWYSVMLDGMGKAKGLGFHESAGAPAASHSGRKQHHALATDARGRVGDRHRRARPARDGIQGKGRADRLSLARSLILAEPNGLALMRRSAHPHASILFIDWMLSEEGQTVLAQQIPRITLRNGIKQIPRHQELYKKEFVFVNPASIGPQSERVDRVLPADL